MVVVLLGSYYVYSIITNRFGENENEKRPFDAHLHGYISRGSVTTRYSMAIFKHGESQDSSFFLSSEIFTRKVQCQSTNIMLWL